MLSIYRVYAEVGTGMNLANFVLLNTLAATKQHSRPGHRTPEPFDWRNACRCRIESLCLPSLRTSWQSRSGDLRTQKLKSHLMRTHSLKVLPLKPGVGQYIAMHAAQTATDFFLDNFYPSGPFICIFSKLLLSFSCVSCG